MPGPSDGPADLGDNDAVCTAPPTGDEAATAAALVERWLPALDAVVGYEARR